MLGCTRLSAIIIGSFLFVHAGIIPEFTKKLNIKSRKDLYKLNFAVRKWLLGLINKEYVSQIVGSFKYSLFWDRILGNIPPNINNNDQIIDCSKFASSSYGGLNTSAKKTKGAYNILADLVVCY